MKDKSILSRKKDTLELGSGVALYRFTETV